jgi:membrane-associated phospholipid phosphatase
MAGLERQTGNDAVVMKKTGWLLLFFVVGGLALFGAFHFDSAVQDWIAQHQVRGVRIFMRHVSHLGDWPGHVAIGLVILGLAWWRGSKKWMRIAVAMLLACALAGLSARAVKIATGRARPSIHAEAGWNGPRLSSKYNAFPSGHTAASTAFFGTLLFVCWRLGLACMSIPLLIAISRMYGAAHYLSDVVVAAWLGLLCSFLAARWLLSAVRHRPSAVEN